MPNVPADTSTEKEMCWWLYNQADEIGKRVILNHILNMEP